MTVGIVERIRRPWYMAPRSAANNLTNRAARYTVFFGDGSLRKPTSMVGQNEDDGDIRQLRRMVALSGGLVCAPMGVLVGFVLALRARNKVIGVDTRARSAKVRYLQSKRDRPVCDLPGNAMRIATASLDVNEHVTVSRAGYGPRPIPAPGIDKRRLFTELVNLRPEPIGNSCGYHGATPCVDSAIIAHGISVSQLGAQ